MRYELVLVVDSELTARDLLSEIVSNLNSLDESRDWTNVESGVVLIDGEEVAVYAKGELR